MKENEVKIKIDFNKVFIFIIITLAMLRLLLFIGMPLVGVATYPHDDTLMINLADNILRGEWLGAYNDKTLIKGVSYPLFIAFCSYLRIPYLTVLGLLYIFSTLIFIWVLKDFIKSKKYILLIYIFILFSPAMFELNYVQRVYRMSIIPSQILLIISCFSAMYIRRMEKIKNIIPWSIGAGISLSFFWLTREDSIWILPFVLAATCIGSIACVLLYKREKKMLLYKVGILLIPLIILICNINIIKTINYKYYGIYEINDLKNTYFSELIGNIYSIRQDEEKKYVWVNRSTVEKLYEVSPTFASIKNEVEFNMNSWSALGAITDDNEVEKDYFMWSLRDAVKMSGHYKDANETNEFYKKINDEIIKAFEEGKLNKINGVSISSLSRPFKREYIRPLIDCGIESMKWVVSYDKCSIGITESVPPNETLRKFEAITNNYLIYPSSKNFVCTGWAFTTNIKDKLIAKIVDSNGNVRDTIDFIKGDDVYQHFYNLGLSYENAKKSRFNTKISDLKEEKLFLNMYIQDDLIQSIDLSLNQQYYETNQYKLYFDNKEIVNVVDPYKEKAERNVNISQKIIKVYKYSGNVLIFFSLVSYIILTIWMFKDLKKKKYLFLDVWLILTGIFFSFIILIAGVSYNYFEAWNRENRNVYLAGAYPLLQMFISLSVVTILLNWKRILKK